MKLNPERWASWGVTDPGALGKVDWHFHTEPTPSILPNHPSALLHRMQLGAQLDQAEAMGMVEYQPQGVDLHSFAQNVLPLGARVKPNGSVRMLVDPSLPGVNDCMTRLPCVLTSPEEIIQHVKPTSVLAKRDLDNGFFHVVLSHNARKYMGFTHPVSGKIGRWVVLPQGTAQSPAIFCAVTEAAARIFNTIFRKEGVACRVFVYVDDFILVADSHDHMRMAFSIMDTEGALLGLSWNPRKDVGRYAPLSSLEALGLLIDAPSLTLSLPHSKRDAYLSEIEGFCADFQGSSTCPRKVMEKLLGKLVFACRVCRWGFLFIQSLLDDLYPGFLTRTPKIPLSDATWHDLRFWRDALGPSFHTWMGKKRHMLNTKAAAVTTSPPDLEIFSDASKKYGVGGVLGSEVLSLPWSSDVSHVHIGALELEAVYKNLVHWKNEITNCTVLVWVDNIQAMTALNKGASRKPMLRDTLLRIAMLGLEHNFEVKSMHIKGELNPADAPSRGMLASSTQDWTFMHMEQFNNPPAEVDCCAAESGYNVQPGCTTWYSAARPVQDHVQDLVGKKLWANVPFDQAEAIIPALIQAWRLDPLNTVITLVVPEWPSCVWYRRFIRRKHPLFTLLHRYPEGSRVFKNRHTHSKPLPCKWPVLVLRLGGPHTPPCPMQVSRT